MGKNKPSSSKKSYSSTPIPGIGPTLYERTVKQGNRSVTAVGYSQKEANKKAGDAFRTGRK